jgi:4-hydroxy-3-methylbut-2-enyl diphosphate reductase IspH
MGIKLAKTAGFCMGVKRAVDMVLDMARVKGNETIYTYGPLIHNPQTVELLRKRGIVPIRRLDEITTTPAGATMVIRAHGISPAERKKIKDKGCSCAGDHSETCVGRLHGSDRRRPGTSGSKRFVGLCR